MNAEFKKLYDAADEEGRYVLDERAAIHEFDGQLPREEAERRTAEECKEQLEFLEL